jgi:hypothetical protein
MDIKSLMQQMHEAKNEAEREEVKTLISSQFNSLSESEKEVVRVEFIESWDEAILFATEKLKKFDLRIEQLENSSR